MHVACGFWSMLIKSATFLSFVDMGTRPTATPFHFCRSILCVSFPHPSFSCFGWMSFWCFVSFPRADQSRPAMATSSLAPPFYLSTYLLLVAQKHANLRLGGAKSFHLAVDDTHRRTPSPSRQASCGMPAQLGPPERVNPPPSSFQRWKGPQTHPVQELSRDKMSYARSIRDTYGILRIQIWRRIRTVEMAEQISVRDYPAARSGTRERSSWRVSGSPSAPDPSASSSSQNSPPVVPKASSVTPPIFATSKRGGEPGPGGVKHIGESSERGENGQGLAHWAKKARLEEDRLHLHVVEGNLQLPTYISPEIIRPT